jgi:FkbH-like protein
VEEGAGWSADDRARATHEVVTRIRALADTFCSRSAAPIFLSTLPPIVDGLDGDVTNLHGSHGLRTTLLSINLEILRLAEKHTRVHVFDFAGWAAQFGEECFDRRLDLFARQPIAAKALSSFALALRRALRPLACARLKVLALDLDNTLWAGTLEEDGIAGLRIGHEFPGNAYRKIQQRAKALKRQGVILVLLTRNDESEVRRAFTELPDMPLTLDDFVAMKANWRPKHENLREVMADLNLGIDSVVFLDDQGFEREEMRWRAPEVHVLEASGPLGLLRALESTDLFDTFEIGDEDHARTDYYAAERERRALGATHEGSRDGFLASLRLKAEIQPVTEGSLGRVVQMLAKTNQFNLTTRRHSEADVRRMLRGPGNILRTVAVSDRFGDLGIVGVVIALADAPANALRIDSFLLSCRAMERGVEDALWADLLAQGALAGVHCLTAEYVPTPKNGHVSALYDRLGMTLVSDVAGRRAYQLILPTRRNAPDWIFIRGGSP